MYGAGDDVNPFSESVELLDEIVVHFICEMVRGRGEEREGKRREKKVKKGHVDSKLCRVDATIKIFGLFCIVSYNKIQYKYEHYF